MKYLLDTNICIYIIKQKPISVKKRFQQYELGEILISSISVAELSYGAAKSSYPEKNQQALLQFLAPLELLDFDYAAALQYGHIRAKLEQLGTPISGMDMQIAAQALGQNITLITNNTKEFQRIDGLNLENWI